MIDILKSDFPADMARAAEFPVVGTWEAAHDVRKWLEDYARDHPASFGLWAFGIGFIVGWKLKRW